MMEAVTGCIPGLHTFSAANKQVRLQDKVCRLLTQCLPKYIFQKIGLLLSSPRVVYTQRYWLCRNLLTGPLTSSNLSRHDCDLCLLLPMCLVSVPVCVV